MSSGQWKGDRLLDGFKDQPTFYSVSHNHGSGKWLYLKGNYYWRDPLLTSMIMGGSVDFIFVMESGGHELH